LTTDEVVRRASVDVVRARTGCDGVNTDAADDVVVARAARARLAGWRRARTRGWQGTRVLFPVTEDAVATVGAVDVIVAVAADEQFVLVGVAVGLLCDPPIAQHRIGRGERVDLGGAARQVVVVRTAVQLVGTVTRNEDVAAARAVE